MKTLKRMLAMLLTLALMAAPAAAETSRMVEKCDQLAREIPELAGNQTYVQTVLQGVNLGEAYFAPLQGCTWEKPLGVVYLSADEAAMLARIEAEGITVTEDTARYLRLAMPNLIVSQLRGGSMAMAFVANVTSSGTYYLDPSEPDGAQVFIRFYEDGLPLVGMVLAQQGAVQLSVNAYVGGDGLAECCSVQDVQNWLDASGKIGIVATEEPSLMQRPVIGAEQGDMPQRALALVQHMTADMGNAEFRNALGTDETIAALLEDWAGGDYTRPRLMAHAPMKAEQIGMTMYGMTAAALLLEADSPAARQMTMTLPGLALNGIALSRNTASMAHMAACSMTTVGTIYPDPDRADGMGMYVLLFDGGHQALVSWNAVNGVVAMKACYLPADMSTVDDVTGITLRLIGMGLALQFEEVVLE